MSMESMLKNNKLTRSRDSCGRAPESGPALFGIAFLGGDRRQQSRSLLLLISLLLLVVVAVVV